MALYEMSGESLSIIPATTFSAEKVLERQHLQAAIRVNPALLGEDLLVVAEEFGEFAEANRRIDLLCLNRAGQLVVVELKRTEDGGHSELQALRYAAMVSTMTLEDVERVLAEHIKHVGDGDDDSKARLADWLSGVDLAEMAVPSREVRIVLVAGGFDKQITSTVLWLNDIYGLDIRCIKITPYRVDHRLLLDVQQLVPLPEAAELTVQLRRRGQAAKVVSSAPYRDFTKYTIIMGDGRESEPMKKRQAIRQMVLALHTEGIPIEQVRSVLRSNTLLPVEGELLGDELTAAFVARYPSAARNLGRWFFDTPIRANGHTWVLSNQWGGPEFEPTLANLAELSPSGLAFKPVPPD